MKQYETMVIVDAMISDDAIQQELNAIQQKIETQGEILRIDDWGKRKMAYAINKKTHGHYAVFYFKAAPTIVKELESAFRLNESVLRWLTLVDQPMTEVIYGEDVLNGGAAEESAEAVVEAEA
jgi:small subunit ribosomal protein S6